MRKVLRVSALMLALGCSVLAGEIQNPVTPPPPPPQQGQADDGLIPTPPAALIDAVLTLLNIALP